MIIKAVSAMDNMQQRIILVTSGEPSGIGPDICLDIPRHTFVGHKIVVIGDSTVLAARAKMLQCNIVIENVTREEITTSRFLHNPTKADTLYVLNESCPHGVTPGVLNAANANYVLNTLNTAIELCHANISNCIVTAPISKQVINQSGIVFSGHTEYFAQKFAIDKVVMMLANSKMKVALLTTHIPLKDVYKEVTAENLNQTLKVIMRSLQEYNVAQPKIAVCGLNPHAGEGGYLGDEELLVINPVIKEWRDKGFAICGSFAADTIFLQVEEYDLILAMYHDQGLPVLKYSGFADGINVTLGLPIIRTSVDHGTALELAGSGRASSSSLIEAIRFAVMAKKNKMEV